MPNALPDGDLAGTNAADARYLSLREIWLEPRVFIDVSAGQLDWRRLYKYCIGFIAPRPIALVSSISPAGRTNLAPFSFFNMCSANPPLVMFCPGLHRDGRRKDTLMNVEATGQFVIAAVDRAIAKPMVACAAELPYGDSEFEYSGLTPAPATRVAPPLIREASVNIECALHQIVYSGVGPGSSAIVFGRIVALHVDDRVLDADGMIDPHSLTLVGRLGGAYYADADEPYEMKIPPSPATRARTD
ncbi:MAG: flavin reductase family protein [Phycisphaerae bacterium]